MHSIALNQHIMKEKLPKITEALITTPSDTNTMKLFLDLVDMFGFARSNIIAYEVEVFSSARSDLGWTAGKC